MNIFSYRTDKVQLLSDCWGREGTIALLQKPILFKHNCYLSGAVSCDLPYADAVGSNVLLLRGHPELPSPGRRLLREDQQVRWVHTVLEHHLVALPVHLEGQSVAGGSVDGGGGVDPSSEAEAPAGGEPVAVLRKAAGAIPGRPVVGHRPLPLCGFRPPCTRGP